MDPPQHEPPRMPGELFRKSLPRDASCGFVARRLVETHLNQRLDGQLDDAKTVASELVNNAYLHGEGQIELRVCASGVCLRIEVIDQGAHSDRVAVRSERSGSRGLAIVDQLAQRWGDARGDKPRVGGAPDPAGVSGPAELTTLSPTRCARAGRALFGMLLPALGYPGGGQRRRATGRQTCPRRPFGRRPVTAARPLPVV